MIKSIGGYFELADLGQGLFPYDSSVLLNSATNALEYILRSLDEIKVVYLPFFTCEVVQKPILKLGLEPRFYHIDKNFEIAEELLLHEGDYIIVNNYFGLKDAYIERLVLKYGDKLIVDNAQAFFAPVLPDVKAIYSPRKFLGVPDGGISVGISSEDANLLEVDDSSNRIEHLLIRKKLGAEAGYGKYQENEKIIGELPLRRMSSYTNNLLHNIDYQKIISTRRRNYQYLNNALVNLNSLNLPGMDTFSCPMVYPFYTNNVAMRSKLIQAKVFVATYWPNVLKSCESSSVEFLLANHVLPLPIDQRYGKNDMERIINLIID